MKTTKDGGSVIQASASGSVGSSMGVSAFTSSQYNYWMSGLLPATPDLPDTSSLAFFYRDQYMFDNVAGSVVDIMSVFPFSEWELRGLEEKELDLFETALDRLNLRDLFPQLSIAHLVDGYFCGSLVYDPQAKNFMDILVHDALQCNVIPSPFNNIDPTVKVTVSGPTLQFLENTSAYAKKYVQSMPRGFIDLLKSGAFTLDPLTTLFVGRRSLTDRAYQSYLHRTLPAYLIEKTMYRGTLVEANRRQRAMTHITAGDDVWTPTAEELRIHAQLFQDAERDPLGGWIATRNSVQLQDVRPGGDFWKWTEMSDTLTPYKLRALGVSEALLSGDTSYAAAESSYSAFLETVSGYRTHLTNVIFYRKIFPIIAVANNLFKDGKKPKNIDPIDFLFNLGNRNKLQQPVLHWQKDLSGKAEDNTMDLLEKLTEHQVPIPLKMWLAAAGIDKDTLVRDAKEDKALREALGVAAQSAPVSTAGGDDEEMGDSDQVTSASIGSMFTKPKVGVLNREFHGDIVLSKTGKPRYQPKAPGVIRDENHRIAKLAASMDDPNTRERARKQNLSTLGADKLSGFA